MMPGMGGKFNARQMNQMMRRLGIQVKEVPDVQEVVIRTSAKQYTFRGAEVTIMDASGQKTYQFTGDATVRDLTNSEKADLVARYGAARGPAAAAESRTETDAEAPAPREATPSAEEQLAEVTVEISDDDIALVASQTGKSPKEARAALEQSKGDLAEAIMQLSA